MNFKVWIENQENWPVEWPLRQGVGDKVTDRDTPPETTASGDYILYHGTNIVNARKIFKERILRHDDMRRVGVTTTPSAAGIYAAMKIKRPNNPGVVLRLVISKDWLLRQEITREIGGSGRD